MIYRPGDLVVWQRWRGPKVELRTVTIMKVNLQTYRVLYDGKVRSVLKENILRFASQS